MPAEEDTQQETRQNVIVVAFYTGGGAGSSGETVDFTGVETAYIQINLDPSNPVPKAPPVNSDRFYIDWIADGYYQVSDVVCDSAYFCDRLLNSGDLISPDGFNVNGGSGIDYISVGTISFTVQKVDARLSDIPRIE